MELEGSCELSHLNDDSDMILEYKTPNPYKSNQNCKLLFGCSSSEHVLVDIKQFDIQDHPSCGYDFLTIAEEKTCGFNNPIFTTTDSQVEIHFQSDNATNAYGFKLQLGCKSM